MSMYDPVYVRKVVSMIYVGVFGRAPDGEGLNYWVQEFQKARGDWRTLSDWMYYAAIAYPGYEKLRDPQKLVESIYWNVFRKTVATDFSGINYWANEIKNNKTTPGYVIADIIWTATNFHKDLPEVQNLVNLTEIALKVAEKLPKPDLNNDNIVSWYELKIFQDILDPSYIDFDKDGKITPNDVRNCDPIIDNLTKQFTRQTIVPIPEFLKDDILDLDLADEFYLPTEISGQIDFSVILLALASEVISSLKKANISPDTLKDPKYHDPEAYLAYEWYSQNIPKLPQFIDIPDVKLYNCLTIQSVERGADNVYRFVISKGGRTYQVTSIQLVYLIFPDFDEFVLDILEDPESGPVEIALAKYAIDLIGTLPTTPCEPIFVLM